MVTLLIAFIDSRVLKMNKKAYDRAGKRVYINQTFDEERVHNSCAVNRTDGLSYAILYGNIPGIRE